MRRLVAAPLAALSSYGWSQQLVAVAPESDPSGFVLIAAVAVGAGLVFLKLKKPELFDKLVAKAKALVKRKPKQEPAAPTYTEPTLAAPVSQAPTTQPPIYSWLIAENAKQRDRIAQLEMELRAVTAPPVPTEVPYSLPTVGFLKA